VAVVRIVLSGLAAKGIACSGRGSGSLDRSEGHAKENSVFLGVLRTMEDSVVLSTNTRSVKVLESTTD
jgi:hypothetical protein